MRQTPNMRAERCRVRTGKYGTGPAEGNNGLFLVTVKGVALKVIASDGGSWDHVSVSLEKNPNRVPTWAEMCAVKDLFWSEEETVVQFHPPRSCYVNCHRFVLHLWRDQRRGHDLPPAWMVGPLPGQTRADMEAAALAVLGQET